MAPLTISPTLEIPLGLLPILSLFAPAKEVHFTAQAAPFNTGRWAVSIFNNGHTCNYHVTWTDVVASEVIERVVVTLGYGKGPDWRTVLMSTFSKVPSGSRGSISGEWNDTQARLLSTSLPHDVELVFERDGGRRLWASRQVLAAASPYFHTLFESGLQESELATSVDIAPSSGDVRRPLECDDSDDDSALEDVEPPAKRHKADVPSFKHHIIKVNEVSYRTYHAVLCWIYTTHIDFAPLLSSFPGSPSEAHRSLSFHLSAFAKSSPNPPFPASPKSVYRLAHFLEIPALKTAALANLKSQLTPSNIAAELFSETSGKYEEVLDVLGDYAASHREEMKKSQGWKESTKGIDGLEGVGRVFARLAEKIL
ncbi:hypothetical protein RQP46_005852 [Phenoliferia psychrophenolica]